MALTGFAATVVSDEESGGTAVLGRAEP
jgi:hypothetical protein